MYVKYSLAALVSSLALLTFAGAAAAQQAMPANPAKDRAATEAAFGRADANADGKLSKEEAAKLPAISAKFDDLDKNKDGALTLDEFALGYTAAS